MLALHVPGKHCAYRLLDVMLISDFDDHINVWLAEPLPPRCGVSEIFRAREEDRSIRRKLSSKL